MKPESKRSRDDKSSCFDNFGEMSKALLDSDVTVKNESSSNILGSAILQDPKAIQSLSKGFSVDQSLEVLLNRNITSLSFKIKSDYVTEPILTIGLEGLWKMLVLEESQFMILTPYGGIMSEVPESATLFPHRKGMLYGIQYSISWDFNEDATKYIKWIRTLYDYLAPYVSKLPRRAYLNYRDLDLAVNGPNTSYVEAQSCGLKYFNQNFKQLVEVKGRVDLGKFFKNAQSIPIGNALGFMFKLGEIKWML